MTVRSASAVALLPLTATGCGMSSAGDPAAADPARGSVLAAFSPYEFVAGRVAGGAADVVNLTKPGAETHDLELSARQVAAVQEADLVVYSAGFQPAVDEAVEDRSNALDVTTAVAERFAEQVPEHADGFRSRQQELAADLRALDGEFRSGLADCDRRESITSHDAFAYLAARYDLEQVPVSGLSPDQEPSPRRLRKVAETARSVGATTVFLEEASGAVAETVAREIGADTGVLDPLESAPETGDYLSGMRANLDGLRAALGCR